MISTVADREQSVLGSVALVTGGSGGIGLAIARRLGHMGALIAICGRSREKLDRAAGELQSSGITVLPLQTDVTRADQIAARHSVP